MSNKTYTELAAEIVESTPSKEQLQKSYRIFEGRRSDLAAMLKKHSRLRTTYQGIEKDRERLADHKAAVAVLREASAS